MQMYFGTASKMDAIREEYEFEYVDGEKDSFPRRYSPRNAYSDSRSEYDDVSELKQNLRAAMKGARQKIAGLRVDLEAKDKMLKEEKSRREELERDLASKTDDLNRDRRNADIYSPVNLSTDYGGRRLLTDELMTAQQLNMQLSEKLSQAETDVAAARIGRNDMFDQTEAQIAARGAALVDKIYRAQKERDMAVNARLKLAGDEREELINHLRRLEREQPGFDSGVDSLDDAEMTMKELLGRLSACESSQLIDKHGGLMVSRIKTVQKNKKRMITEELKAVLAERDEAVEKVNILEAEVSNLRREVETSRNQPRIAEKQRIKANQMQLMQVQQQRDLSMKKSKRLEEELETVRVYYSLHKSLSQEKNLREQFNHTMDSFEDRLKSRESELQLSQHSYNDIVARLRSTSQERNVYAAQLQEVTKNHEREKGRADKLERLVGVLRKRISESGGQSVPTVN